MDIAKWFIKNNYDKPRNSFDGNMKLQKLLYFSQLIHLAKYGDLLFEDQINAFENGSVVEEVRQNYCYDNKSFVEQANQFTENFTEDQLNTLKIVVDIFGDIDPMELSDLNHLHKGWKNAFSKSIDPFSSFYHKELSQISIDDIKKYDLERVSSMLKVYESNQKLDQKHEIVNGIKFFYDPNEIEMTQDIIEKLKSFKGDESCYTICNDSNMGLVIY